MKRAITGYHQDEQTDRGAEREEAGEEEPGGICTPPSRDDSNDGGDPPCWAELVCPECGAVLGGGPHRQDCPTHVPGRRRSSADGSADSSATPGCLEPGAAGGLVRGS